MRMWYAALCLRYSHAHLALPGPPHTSVLSYYHCQESHGVIYHYPANHTINDNPVINSYSIIIAHIDPTHTALRRSQHLSIPCTMPIPCLSVRVVLPCYRSISSQDTAAGRHSSRETQQQSIMHRRHTHRIRVNINGTSSATRR